MLHELLLALIGETGSIIVETEEGLQVSEHITFLSQPQIDLINTILKTATDYVYLSRFCKQFGSLTGNLQFVVQLRRSTYDEDEETTGLYIKALCSGIEQLLDQHRNCVLKLEEDFLRGRCLTMMHIQDSLIDLRGISSIIRAIETEKFRGAQLLDKVYRHENLCAHLRTIFFHQLIAWVVYGQLLDSHYEFFISEVEDSADDTQWSARYTLNLDMLPQTCMNSKLAEKILFIGKAMRIMMDSRNTDPISTETIEQFASALRETQASFKPILLTQVIERIRTFITHRLWSLIMVKTDASRHLAALKDFFLLSKGEFFHEFLEESRVMFSLPPKPDTGEYDLNHGPFTQAISNLRLDDDAYVSRLRFKLIQIGFTYPDFTSVENLSLIGNAYHKHKKVIRLVTNVHSRRPAAVWYNRKQVIDSGFNTQLQLKYNNYLATASSCITFMIQWDKEVLGSLENCPSSARDLENCILIRYEARGGATRIYIILKKDGREIILAENRVEIDILTGQTHHFGLQYEGEVVRAELDGTIMADAKHVLEGSIYLGFGLEAQGIIEVLSWGMAGSQQGLHPAVFDSWNGLTIDYQPPWPLHLLLSPQTLDRYNALFRFLFTLKRAQFHLQRAWSKRLSFRPAAQLRNQMAFLMDNFMSYLQVDVIEAEWAKFQGLILKSEDFEEVRRYHEHYISQLTTSCFLHISKISKMVQEIARCCNDYCVFLNKVDFNDVQSKGEMYRVTDELNDHKSRFDRECVFIFKVLRTVGSHPSSLAQLLLRIDYNQYFTMLTDRVDRPSVREGPYA